MEQKNGQWKEYNKDGDLIFEGEYINGSKNGKGKEYKKGKLYFEGDYLYSYKLKGKEYINDYLEYEGEYLFNTKWDGKGYDKDGNIIYNLIQGTGKVKEYYFEGQLKFEGEYLKGLKNGEGKEYNIEGNLIYDGVYLNGEKKKVLNKYDNTKFE